MILAIVGCHKWTDPETAESLAKVRIRADIKTFQPELVISGGAEGIDTWVEQVCQELGQDFRPFLPKYPRWEPEGYKERNIEIAKTCTDLTAIRCSLRSPCAVTGTYGSGKTAETAEKWGKRVRRIVL